MRTINLISIKILPVVTFLAIVVLLPGCTPSQDNRKALMLKVFDEAWNKGNVDALDDMYAVDYFRHEPSARADIKGLEAFKQHRKKAHAKNPDEELIINNIFIEGNTSIVQWTHKPRISPTTGKQVIGEGCSILLWQNDKIVEGWNYVDVLTAQQQVGYTLVPPSGPDDERDVKEREKQYWEHLKAKDFEGFMAFFHDDWVAWPSIVDEPLKKDDLRKRLVDSDRTKESYSSDLKPQAVQLFGNIAVVHYLMNETWKNNDGRKVSRVVKYTHTWVKEEGTWKVIGGMGNTISSSE